MILKGVLLAALVLGCCLGCDADDEPTSTPVVSATPSPTASATPTASASPTAPPCVADQGPTTNQYTVSWVIFSGLRDPSWKLTAAQSLELRTRITDVPGSALPVDKMDGLPGEVGYIVKAAPSEDRFLAGIGLKEREFWVPYGETATFLASTMPCSAFG